MGKVKELGIEYEVGADDKLTVLNADNASKKETIINIGGEGVKRDSKVIKEIIENEMVDIASMYPESRVYVMNGSYLTREEFIEQVALSLYINEPNTDIRETIDLLLNDTDMKELVCSGGDKFFSYIVKHSRQYDFDGDISSIVVEKYMETPLRGLRRKAGVIEDPIAGIEHDIVEKVMKEEEHPLKTYKVSYDVLIVPTISFLQHKKTYKRVNETVQATSFKQAKEMVRSRVTDLGKVTKSYEVELINTEAGL